MVEASPNQVEIFRQYLSEDPAHRIILAVDFESISQLPFIDPRVIARVGMVKIGHSLNNTATWPTVVRALYARSAQGYYFDARYSENPDQLESSVRSLQKRFSLAIHARPTKMVSVDAVKASDEALKRAAAARGNMMIIGETIPPSTTFDQCMRRYGRSPVKAVAEYSHIAHECGLQGIAASPLELPVISCDPRLSGLLRIAMGIREEGESTDDQQRTASLRRTIMGGAEMVVLGRTILRRPFEEQYGALEEAIDVVDEAVGLL